MNSAYTHCPCVDGFAYADTDSVLPAARPAAVRPYFSPRMINRRLTSGLTLPAVACAKSVVQHAANAPKGPASTVVKQFDLPPV